MQKIIDFLNNNTGIVTILGGVLGGVLVYLIERSTKFISNLFKYFFKFIIFIKNFIFLPSIKSLIDKEIFGFNYYTLMNAKDNYIDSKFQDKDPSSKDDLIDNNFEARESIIDKFIIDIFNDKNNLNKYFIILAGTGMGKTTLLINLFFKYRLRRIRKYNIVLMPIHNLDQIDILEKIKNLPNKDKTILLLDALDEDIEAKNNYNLRIEKLTTNTSEFFKVVITCRTHFFNSFVDEPNNINVATFDTQCKNHLFTKMYISPFTDKDIRDYINKKYHKMDRIIAFDIVKKCPNLSIRPMILGFLDDLISKKIYHNIYDIYQRIIDKWIEREGLNTIILDNFLSIVASYIYNKNNFSINESELENLIKNNNINITIFEAKTKSILNRYPNGELKFSHRSFYEFFIAKQTIKDITFSQYVRFDNLDFAELIFNEKLDDNPNINQKITALRFHYENNRLLMQDVKFILDKYEMLEKEILTNKYKYEYVRIKIDLALFYYELGEIERLNSLTYIIYKAVMKYEIEDYKLISELLHYYCYSVQGDYTKFHINDNIESTINEELKNNARLLCYALRILADIYEYSSRILDSLSILENIVKNNYIMHNINLVSVNNIYNNLERNYYRIGAYDLSNIAHKTRKNAFQNQPFVTKTNHLSFYLYIKNQFMNKLRWYIDKDAIERIINNYIEDFNLLDERFKRQKWVGLLNIGISFREKDNYDEAFNYYNKALEHLEDSFTAFYRYNVTSADTYFLMKDYSKGLEILENFESSDIFRKETKNKAQLSNFYFTKALLKNKLNLDPLNDINSSIKLLECYNNESSTYLELRYKFLMTNNISHIENIPEYYYNVCLFLYKNLEKYNLYYKWILIANNLIISKAEIYAIKALDMLPDINNPNINKEVYFKNLEFILRSLISLNNYDIYKDYLVKICNEYTTYINSTNNIELTNDELFEDLFNETPKLGMDKCEFIEKCKNVVTSESENKGELLLTIL